MAAPSVTCLVNASYTAGVLNVVGRDLLGTEVDVYRVDQVTGVKMLVRGGYGAAVTSQTVIVVDPEVPLGEAVIYEIVMMPNGRGDPLRQSVLSAGCKYPDTSVNFDVRLCEPVYLSDPLIPSFGSWFGLLGIDPLSYPSRSELYDVLGRSAPVAVSQRRSTARTTIRLLSDTLDLREDMLEMLAAGRILMLRNPDTRYPEKHWYVAVEDVSEERILTDHRDPRRRWVLNVAVVDRPVGYLALVKNERIYTTYRTYEPDGRTPITPATYAGAYADYGDYVEVLLGGGTAASTLTGELDPETETETRRGDPYRLGAYAYGHSRYPTVEAAHTSWSLR